MVDGTSKLEKKREEDVIELHRDECGRRSHVCYCFERLRKEATI